MNNRVRISVADMLATTDVNQERNIYTHPNSVARDIFWQRLESLHALLAKYADPSDRMLDFGGGSGAFVKGLRDLFPRIDLLDLDPADAESLIAHMGLDNINVISSDVRDFEPTSPYDGVVLADVLEHFEDLSLPVGWLKHHVKKPGGLLFVSLPTENWLYELGRKVVRKTKPLDHYHSSKDVLGYLESQGFEIIARHFAPRYLVRIPLFDIAVLRHASG